MLRGINVSGQNQVAMPALKNLFEELGHGDVQTYLQSGNVVFTAEGTAADLSGSLAAGIEHGLGLRLPVVVRSAQELAAVLSANPFLDGREIEPAGLYVTFLQYPPTDAAASGLLAPLNAAPDEFILAGREVYLHCPNGYGRTKLNNNFFEKKLKTPATTRNWNTVRALCEMSRKD